MSDKKSAPRNRSILSPWKSCFVTILIEEMIKGGWVAEEDKFQEVAQIYKGHTQQLEKEMFRMRQRMMKMEMELAMKGEE